MCGIEHSLPATIQISTENSTLVAKSRRNLMKSLMSMKRTRYAKRPFLLLVVLLIIGVGMPGLSASPALARSQRSDRPPARSTTLS